VETVPVSPSQIEKPQSYYVIVMGCYSTEENALVMVNSLKENGLATAFAGQRGKLWDVYSGSYATMDEAKAAMKEIREKFSPKVWILQKK
ncbi:MAG: SPOR domain-containing protein, partial [Bacteroidales bacterium]|nr:SPOR domain-containing protein [Bacteroidales bacterium]